MSFGHVTLKLDERGAGQVFLDGSPVKGVTAIAIKGAVDMVPEVTLTLIASVDCDLAANVNCLHPLPNISAAVEGIVDANCTPEALAKLLRRELRKQAEMSASYVEEPEGVDGLTSIDGHFDLVAVANGILADVKEA